MEHSLTPWLTFVIIPVFALSNAGIDLLAVAWREALTHSVTLGVVCGLVFGKFAGIALFSWVAPRSRVASSAAWLAGIGFTMSLFIAQLAFSAPELVKEAKLGILLGSALSAVVGLVWLCLAGGARIDAGQIRPGNVY
jgi:NhaA family Na+:H+ antiporter